MASWVKVVNGAGLGSPDSTKLTGTLMSIKVPEGIDLNCDAVPVDQENERNDVNVREPASVAATACLAETVTEGVVDGRVREFGDDNAGVDEFGEEGKMECVKGLGIDLEADIGSYGETFDDKVSAGLSPGEIPLAEVDGGLSGKKSVEAEQMAVGFSGGVTEDLNVNASPNSVGGKPLSSVDQSSLPCDDQKMSLKEGSSGVLESCDMEIGTPDDTEKNQTTVIQGERDLQNAENLNQPTGISEDGSSDVDAKPEFCISDLVWGKVRSHPWWPGQIFDSSAATANAKKYFKKGKYLIAYYGDQTFAWNEASQIKPLRPHFSQMEKQNNMEEFHHAVDCALDEVSRRVEFGLACSCISEEAYSQIKSEIIVNAGIREECSSRDGGDRFSSASSFDPLELVETMKTLALSPFYTEVDRLQFTISQAQLLAFHRWKGYSQLPEFQYLCGLLETDAEIPLSEEVKEHSKQIKNVPSVKVDEQVYSEEEKPESHDGSSRQQKKIHTVSGKKEKSLSEFIAERRLSLQNVKRKLNKKGDDMLMPSSPAKRLKTVDPVHADLVVKQNKSNVSTASVDKPLQSKQSFRVGASILRVASQLNGSIFSTPLLKRSDGTSPKAVVANKSKGKSSAKSRGKTVSQINISSPDDMLSQLRSAATDPLKGYNFLASIIYFFTELRNSIAMDLNNSEMSEQSLEQGTDAAIGEKSTEFKLTGKSGFTSIGVSSCSERIIQCLPEEQLTTVDKNNQTAEKGISVVESHVAIDENLGMEAEKKIAEDQSPTSLILKFSDIDSVPSVEELNEIFGRYGPLVTQGTEVFKRSIQAKVVYERRTDAETAFSSSGKYSIFGPSLVSYRLKRLASAPTKASQGARKKSRAADETCGN
ncbi:hypothetical protein V6N13_059932 [Hibiscus sabdariffa]